MRVLSGISLLLVVLVAAFIAATSAAAVTLKKAETSAVVSATGCTSELCQVVEGLMRAVGVQGDLSQCSPDLDAFATSLEVAINDFADGRYEQSLVDMSSAMNDLSAAVQGCQLQALDQAIDAWAAELGLGRVEIVDNVVSIIVAGNNIYEQLAQVTKDYHGHNWPALGQDLGTLVNSIQNIIHCNTDGCKILGGLLQAFELLAEDMGPCEAEIQSSFQDFSSAASQFSSAQYEQAVASLAAGLHQLAEAAGQCQLPAIATLIEDEASRLGLANVTFLDNDVQIIINGADIYNDVYNAVQCWIKGDYYGAGSAIGQLIQEIQLLSCDSTVCDVVNGLLRGLQLIAQDMGKCKNDLDGAYDDFVQAASDFKNKQYTASVQTLAASLNEIAQALQQCNLPQFAQLISTEAQKLGIANITEINNVVHIVVQGADVYSEIYDAINAWESQNYLAFGRDIGSLLNMLRARSCSSEICILVEGLLQGMEIVAQDMGACATDLEATWADIQAAMSQFGSAKYEEGLASLANALHEVSQAVGDCQLQEVAQLIDQEAQHLAGGNVQWLNNAVQILIDGANVYDDIYSAVQDFESGNYAGAGNSIGNLLSMIQHLGCNTTACNIVEGLMETLELVADDLGPCSADLDQAVGFFESAVAQFQQERFEAAIVDVATGLDYIAQAVSQCGLTQLATVLENEAKLLGFHDVSVIDDAVQIIVAGADLYEDFFDAAQDFSHSDWRGFGQNLGNMILKYEEMRSKTGACTTDICTVVQGIMSALNIMSNIKQCEADLSATWGDFDTAMNDFAHRNYKDSVHELGTALHEAATALNDCHVEQLTQIVVQVAEKLGLASFSWIDEVIHIVIEGADIYDDLYDSVVDYEAQNYLGFGLDLGKLIIKLIDL
eukprot:GEZU01029275.1.p1 GENE.GEZU01029275.1~~GEZU01029275.1.p1  ORF type:complete len:892 (-),score=374.14 GEZU01029275.1:181-2856(-)